MEAGATLPRAAAQDSASPDSKQGAEGAGAAPSLFSRRPSEQGISKDGRAPTTQNSSVQRGNVWQRITVQKPGFKGSAKKPPEAPARSLKSEPFGASRQFRAVPVSQARMHRKESMLDKQGHQEEAYERLKTRNENRRRRLPVSFLSQ